MPGKKYVAPKARPGSCSSPQLVDFLAWVSMVNCQCGVERQGHVCQWVLHKARYGFNISEDQVHKLLGAANGKGGAFAQSQSTSSPKCTVATQSPRWKLGYKSVALQTEPSSCEQAVQCEDLDCTKSSLPSDSESAIARAQVLSVSQKRRRRRRLLRQRRFAVQ